MLSLLAASAGAISVHTKSCTDSCRNASDHWNALLTCLAVDHFILPALLPVKLSTVANWDFPVVVPHICLQTATTI